MQYHGRLGTILFLAISAQAFGANLRSYSYVSPAASTVLKKARITAKELEAFVDAGLASRSLRCIESDVVYEGSEDSLRIDIRKQSRAITIELSVRQGVSIHNMLQRWAARAVLSIDTQSSQDAFRDALFKTITTLLDDLKREFNSTSYKQGKMMEE